MIVQIFIYETFDDAETAALIVTFETVVSSNALGLDCFNFSYHVTFTVVDCSNSIPFITVYAGSLSDCFPIQKRLTMLMAAKSGKYQPMITMLMALEHGTALAPILSW